MAKEGGVEGVDLLQKCFEQVTGNQAKTADRTDSKTMKTNLLVIGVTVHAILKVKP